MVEGVRTPELNDRQAQAATYGIGEGNGPLLIIAGAGSGKTMTLAHRVAHLIQAGADPERILMLTFTRRAAAEMASRAGRILARASAEERAGAKAPADAEARAGAGAGADAEAGASAKAPAGPRQRATLPEITGTTTATHAASRVTWTGTFHSIANRLLRLHGQSIGLDPSFTVLDRSDSADLMDLVRSALAMDRKDVRFPKKATCLAIYSHVVNTQDTLELTLRSVFPWCEQWASELRATFGAYVEAKQKRNVFDYDDLLLWWRYLMDEPSLAALVGGRFDHVLVDEYQDTNLLQASIVLALKPDGRGVTVVGDDAQSIYSFRGATVRNILDFPHRYRPAARVVTLTRNYRSRQPVLDACNAVIRLAPERYAKELCTTRPGGRRPLLITAEDEAAQVAYVADRVLEQREAGVELKRQAVLFRTAHHSDALEVELARRSIPFVKFGGLKFLEAAHVKDVLCVLRWAENPRDEAAAFRVLQLLPGVGPVLAARVIESHESSAFEVASLWSVRMPAAATEDWQGLLRLLTLLRNTQTSWSGQLAAVHAWYSPALERIYDHAWLRSADLEQLEQIASQYVSRERFLTELTLDPPSASGNEAGPPLLDEDYLILSTIHSAKGQEWDTVYLLNVVDGCIPSDMATGNPEQIEEERRLLYVAMSRAREELHLIQPLRFYVHGQQRRGDRHMYAPRSRFLPDSVLPFFERGGCGVACAAADSPPAGTLRGGEIAVDVKSRLREMWK